MPDVLSGWNGTRKLTGPEFDLGATALSELMPLLPDLKVVVLVGQRAANSWSKYSNARGLPTVVSAHPSPVNFAFARTIWNEIPNCWAEARKFLR